jgi:hypothetical protein
MSVQPVLLEHPVRLLLPDRPVQPDHPGQLVLPDLPDRLVQPDQKGKRAIKAKRVNQGQEEKKESRVPRH